MCIYIYIYTHICLSVYLSVSLSLYIHIYIYIDLNSTASRSLSRSPSFSFGGELASSRQTFIHIHQYIFTVSNSKQVYCILDNWCTCIKLSCGARYRELSSRHRNDQPRELATCFASSCVFLFVCLMLCC